MLFSEQMVKCAVDHVRNGIRAIPEGTLDAHSRSLLLHDYKQAVEDIWRWMHHIVRFVYVISMVMLLFYSHIQNKTY